MSNADTLILDWLERQHTLHRAVEVTYVVDGYTVEITRDGSTIAGPWHGDTLRQAYVNAMQHWDMTHGDINLLKERGPVKLHAPSENTDAQVLARVYFHPGANGDYDIHDSRNFRTSPECPDCIQAVIVPRQWACTTCGSVDCKFCSDCPDGTPEVLNPLAFIQVPNTAFALSRYLLWCAFVWNDHNFGDLHTSIRERVKKLGINSLEDANTYLTIVEDTSLLQVNDDQASPIAWETRSLAAPRYLTDKVYQKLADADKKKYTPILDKQVLRNMFLDWAADVHADADKLFYDGLMSFLGSDADYENV